MEENTNQPVQNEQLQKEQTTPTEKKSFPWIPMIIGGVVVVSVIVGGLYYYVSNTIGCTTDTMQCPDGSQVARGPNCEFAECPQSAYNDLPQVGENLIYIEEISIFLKLPDGHFARKNQEVGRRGSVISYEMVELPVTLPRVDEVQFFTRDSIADFNEKCDEGDYCWGWRGNYPTVSLYDAQKEAYESRRSYLDSKYKYIEIGGRGYFVKYNKSDGFSKEYVTFLDDTMVSIIVFLGGFDMKIDETETASEGLMAQLEFVESVDTSNWQTYLDKYNRFEFKYPENWFISEDRSRDAIHYVYLNRPDLKDEVVRIIIPMVPTSQVQKVECPFSSHEIECSVLRNSNGVLYSKSINTNQLEKDKTKELTIYLITYLNRSVEIPLYIRMTLTDINGNPLPKSKENTAIVDLIVDSILLQNTDTSNWQTYTNEEFIEKVFSDKKVVYKNDAVISDIRENCDILGGVFNQCGSPCAPDAEVCITVCAKTCEIP